MRKILKKDRALFMLDIETTGLSPVLNSITSVAIVHFASDTMYPIRHLHFKFSDRLNNRHDDADTMKWRGKNNVGLQESSLDSHDISIGLRLISNFIDNACEGKTPVLLSKHIDFDVAFLKGYYAVKGYKFPIYHRNIFDLDSIIQGMGVDADTAYENAKQTLSIEYKPLILCPHDALYDCLLQIEYLVEASLYGGQIEQCT